MESNQNLNNEHVASVVGYLSSNQETQQNVTDAPPAWYLSILGCVDELTIFNKTDIDLDFHIFGSTIAFNIKPEDIKEGSPAPDFYKMLVSVRACEEKSIKPLSKEVQIIVTYVNDKNQIVKVLTRTSNPGKSFNLLQRHLEADEVKVLTLDEFNAQLLEAYPNYVLVNCNNNNQ